MQIMKKAMSKRSQIINKLTRMRNIFKFLFLFLVILGANAVSADGAIIKFVLQSDGKVVYSEEIPLPEEGTVEISDSDGVSQTIDARSVLNIIDIADGQSSDFRISELKYYSSFSAFYLRCINVAGDDLCDDWQYHVDGSAPSEGMDKNILSGSEEITVFYGKEELDEDTEAPPEETESRSTSSGSTRRSKSVGAKAKEVVEPEVESITLNSPAEEPEMPDEVVVLQEVAPPAVVLPVQTVAVSEVKNVVKKPNSEKESESLSGLASGSVANVITVEEVAPSPQVEVVKDSWFRRVIKWVFGR